MANSPIKLPPVLICIGQLKQIETGDTVYKFPLKDKVMLFCAPNGKALYCMAYTAKKADKAHFEKVAKGKHAQILEGMKLYEKWHEFEPSSGSLCSPPRGFLFDAGRAVSIIYQSDKWTGKKQNYIHTFKICPKLRVNKKSTQPTLLVLTGGRIRVKKEGITG